MRKLFLAGHGSIDAKKTGCPFDSVAREILDPTVTYQAAELPAQRRGETFRESRWIFGAEAKTLVFKMSQFAGSADLIGALHQVRDRVLEGATPFVFWDEFAAEDRIFVRNTAHAADKYCCRWATERQHLVAHHLE